MKKTIRNTLNDFQIEQLIQLLEKGYTLNDAIHLFINFPAFHNISFVKEGLESGQSIENVLSSLSEDPLFKELFLTLYPIKGLLYALKESLNLIKERNEWVANLRKKITYPLILIFVMVLFSIFVHFFLLPEIDLLFNAFDYTNTPQLTSVIVHIIPVLLLCMVLVLMCILFSIYYAITHHKKISLFIKIPIISVIIKTYYSLKFSFYLSKLSVCFDSFYDTIHYFYKTHHQNDLKPVLNHIYYQLEEGLDIQTIIKNTIYFTDDFKSFFYLILTTKQSLNMIDNYYILTIQSIENKLKYYTNLFLALIYLCVGIYVMSLYSIIIMPVLELTTLM